jgi:hypothetical protein
MTKGLGIVLLVILLSQQLYGQIMPSDNVTLNYRIAGLSVPENTKASAYIFQIAKGNITDERNFQAAVFVNHKSSQSKDLTELPFWGKQYTWCVKYCDKTGKEIGNSGLHHFATGNLSYGDTSYAGLVILKQATEHKDMCLLTDGVLVIYDINGNPVWYMPDMPQIRKRDFTIRDFKATADGTFTFMTQDNAYEVDYNGKIIWQAPNDGKVSGVKNMEGYHHEFTKLANGHYMIAGSELINRTIPNKPTMYYADGDTTVKQGADGKYYKQLTSGTLIEYDASGSVIWSWRASEHFNDVDFFWPKVALDKPYDGNTYMNAFEIDESHKVIYISFKNINKIIKIAYPGGEILNSYGEMGNHIQHKSPFYGQHSCRINPRTGVLCVYNNNHNDFEPISQWQIDTLGYVTSHIVKYKQPTGKGSELQNTWDVGCRMIQDRDVPQVSIRGGSVVILDDDCVLANMGTMNQIMIINKNKQMVFDAVPYVTDETNRRTAMIPYRCNYMHRKDFGKFVFRKGN